VSRARRRDATTSLVPARNVVKPWPWRWGAHGRGSGAKATCTTTSQHEGQVTDTGSATPGSGASATPRRGLGLETLWCARARTHARIHLKREQTRHKGLSTRTRGTACRPARGAAARRGVSLGPANGRTARHLVAGSARRCGLGWPRCRVPLVWCDAAAVYGETAAHGGSKARPQARNLAKEVAQDKAAGQLTLGRRCSRRWLDEEDGAG
jgi:hypothetical protein